LKTLEKFSKFFRRYFDIFEDAMERSFWNVAPRVNGNDCSSPIGMRHNEMACAVLTMFIKSKLFEGLDEFLGFHR